MGSDACTTSFWLMFATRFGRWYLILKIFFSVVVRQLVDVSDEDKFTSSRQPWSQNGSWELRLPWGNCSSPFFKNHLRVLKSLCALWLSPGYWHGAQASFPGLLLPVFVMKMAFLSAPRCASCYTHAFLPYAKTVNFCEQHSVGLILHTNKLMYSTNDDDDDSTNNF